MTVKTHTQDAKNYFPIVLSVAFASFMVRLNNYTVNVSLPAMAEYFDVGTVEISRVVMSYLLIVTSTLLVFGKLGDRMGLRKIFLFGYGIFVIGSLLSGLSFGIHMLIGSRLIQGIGGAMLLATSFAIITRFIPQERRGWAFGITSTASALGVATGAPLGGIVTGYLSWHWVFFLNVPVGVLAILVAGRNIKKESRVDGIEEQSEGGGGNPSRKADRKERFDFPGALFSFFGLSVLLYGINTAKELGWKSPLIMGCFLLAAVLLGLLILRELKFSSPLLDLGLFKNIGFSLALCATFMSYMFITGNAFILPFYLKTTKGLNSQQIGMVLLVYSLIYVFMSSRAGKLSDKMSPVTLCALAMGSAAVNTFIFAGTLHLQGLLFVFIFLIWMGFSFVFFFSPNNNQVMRFAPANRQGVASGLFNTTTNLGMVFGVALFEMVFSTFSGKVSLKTAGTAATGIQRVSLLSGFEAVYLFGGLICLGALVFSLLVKGRAGKGQPAA
jgi:MFS family permease